MNVKQLTLGGLTIPILASLKARCELRPVERSSLTEMGDGSAVGRTYAGLSRRYRVVISAEGPVPPGLDGMDFSSPLLFQSPGTLSITSSVANIVIPAARRSDTDYEPWGRAFVNGRVVPTPVVMAGDTAQLTPVAGADSYQVFWYPEFMVYKEPDGLQTVEDIDGAIVSWELTLRQS